MAKYMPAISKIVHVQHNVNLYLGGYCQRTIAVSITASALIRAVQKS